VQRDKYEDVLEGTRVVSRAEVGALTRRTIVEFVRKCKLFLVQDLVHWHEPGELELERKARWILCTWSATMKNESWRRDLENQREQELGRSAR